MKKNILIGVGVVLFLVLAFFLSTLGNKEDETKLLSGKKYVEISVKDYGKISLELDADIAPITVTNFMKLVNEKHYDGTKFHRIIKGFMVQGGGNKDNPADTITGEFAANGVENKLSHERGVISMARNSYNMNSASDQFFIMHEDGYFLDGNYAAFGEVTSGIETVDSICDKVRPIDNNGTVPKENQPVIEYIKVIE